MLFSCLQLAMLFSCLQLAMLFSCLLLVRSFGFFSSGSSICTCLPSLLAYLLSGVTVCECVSLAPRAPYPPSFAVGCLGLSRACVVSTSCSPRPRADPRVRCAWSGVTQNHSLPSSSHGCVRRGRCLQSSVVSLSACMVVNSAVPRVLPLSCVAGNTSSLSLCLEGLHTAPFVGLLLCSVSHDRALWYSLTCGLLN